MKIPPRDIESFISSPNPKARVILIYGPDEGLMRERAKKLAQTVVADINDPFNAATLTGMQISEDPARLNDEAQALSMMGGARCIRITEATDSIAPALKDYLQNPSAQNLVIVESGNLTPRSPLRSLCEKDDNAAALPCYVEDERDLTRTIRDILREGGYNAEPDAVSWLAANLTGDRLRARRELEKLMIYTGAEKNITLADARACCGTAGAQSLDDLVYAAAGNKPARTLKVYQALLEEGLPVIAILRALQNHFRRLHYAKAFLGTGKSTDQAMKSLTPPVFFKQQDAFRTQLSRWSPKALETTLSRLADLEARCKQTGAPVETLCGQALLGISAK